MASHAAMASETAMASHAAMASETAAAGGGPTTAGMGTFHRVDGDAQGTAALIHLANGSFEITLEDFSISSIDHTNIIIVMSRDVTKSSDVDQATLVDLGPLKATSGMQDFPVPAGASDPMAFHTVVLWDTTMKHAIAAAPLK